MRREQPRKSVAAEKSIFTLAQISQRVDARKLGVDLSRMAHNDAPVGHAIDKIFEQSCVIGAGAEHIGAGKCRIGAQAALAGETSKAAAQAIEQKRLVVAEAPARRQPAALAYPGLWCRLFGHTQERIANLREKMHMLVTVDEVRRPAECGIEGLELAQYLDGQ